MWNIKLFVVAEVLVLIFALFVAIVRQLPGRAFMPIRVLAIVYADVFRGVPTIIVIFLICYGFPLAGVEPFASHMAPNTQLFWLGTLSLVLVYGAYVAEVYRSGLESVHWSQTAAAAIARALAMADPAPRRDSPGRTPDPAPAAQ